MTEVGLRHKKNVRGTEQSKSERRSTERQQRKNNSQRKSEYKESKLLLNLTGLHTLSPLPKLKHLRVLSWLLRLHTLTLTSCRVLCKRTPPPAAARLPVSDSLSMNEFYTCSYIDCSASTRNVMSSLVSCHGHANAVQMTARARWRRC